MPELTQLRDENTKIFDLGGGKRQLEAHIGAIHYKDNYADTTEAWKDIDPTWVGNQILTAPYELTRDGNKLTFKDKKTGEVSTIERTSVFPPGIDLEVIPELSAVRFRHTLPSSNIPFEAQFKVTGKPPITRAYDDDGELELATSLVGDVLTEKLSQVKDKQTGKVRPAKGSIRIDPTWQVGASSDDCVIYNSIISLTASSLQWRHPDVPMGWGCRWLNVTIPQGATIDTAYMTWTGDSTNPACATRTIYGNDTDNAATFSTAANFNGRTRTTASVGYAPPATTNNVEYDTSSLVTIIQEIVDRAGWASGNALALLQNEEAPLNPSYGYAYDQSTTKAPKLVVTYTIATIVTPSTLTLTLTKYAPTVYTGQTVTPTTLFLILQTFSPELLSGIFPLKAATGRYGLSPSVSNEGILTASGRYGG